MARRLTCFFKPEFFHICRQAFQPQVFLEHSQKVRLYVTTAIVKKPENEIPIYNNADKEYKVSRKATVEILKELLNINTVEALDIAMNNVFFKNAYKAMLKKNYELYIQKGVTRETLVKYPEILTVLDANNKIKEIQKLPYDLNAVAILVILPNTSLVNFVMSESSVSHESQGKIGILSSLLQISEQKACELIANRRFLTQVSPFKIKTNIELLLSYGVSTEHICNDLWTLRYSTETIRTRLDTAKKHNIEILKTWMVRVPDKALQTHIQRYTDNKSILGENSLAEYLSERLECNIDFANYLILKQPALKSRSLKKLKELIDFLYSEGVKPEQICRVPKMLVHNVETTRKRIKQLQEKNIRIDGLSMLTKSQRQYMQHYEAMIKSKNKGKRKP